MVFDLSRITFGLTLSFAAKFDLIFTLGLRFHWLPSFDFNFTLGLRVLLLPNFLYFFMFMAIIYFSISIFNVWTYMLVNARYLDLDFDRLVHLGPLGWFLPQTRSLLTLNFRPLVLVLSPFSVTD